MSDLEKSEEGPQTGGIKALSQRIFSVTRS
jgi:hypothetical protein